MASESTEAEAFAIGIELGIVPVSEVVAWADRHVAAADVPPPAICELSMAESLRTQTVVNLLRSIAGPIDSTECVRLTVGNLLIALQSSEFDPESVARTLFDLALNTDLPNGPFKARASWYWDAICLSRDGIGHETVAEIRADMLETMSEFVGCSGND